mmetsp:Transcript_11934/g.18213  ORF Transcript_11934/g.18213 Transcript_11934/m.18213 type:complete len:128 (-) Transcript_11934:2-385(-)
MEIHPTPTKTPSPTTTSPHEPTKTKPQPPATAPHQKQTRRPPKTTTPRPKNSPLTSNTGRNASMRMQPRINRRIALNNPPHRPATTPETTNHNEISRAQPNIAKNTQDQATIRASRGQKFTRHNTSR